MANEKPDAFHFGDVVVDTKNFRVVRDGQEVTLTPRAFDVLVFLIRNSGRVVEKQELFSEIWKGTFVSDNALTKVIKEIRHTLNDDATAPRYIETIPKRGYRFIAEVMEGAGPSAVHGLWRIPDRATDGWGRAGARPGVRRSANRQRPPWHSSECLQRC